MKKCLIAYIILIFTCAISHAQSMSTAVSINGALMIKHGKIVNKNGVEPQLHGVSFSWSIWQGQKYYTAAVVDWLLSDFKISIMRAAVAVQPDSGYLQKPEMQAKLIQDVVDEAIKDGIYVIIDWHDHHSNLHIAQSKAFFAMMAKRYAGVPNVIYEIWNEPEKIGWDTVKSYALQIIPEIRKYDTHNLIIVGSPHWDQDVDVAAANPIKGYKNIAYSFHFYASDPNHQQPLRDKADMAIKKGLPILVTEWGVGEASGDGKFDMPEVNTWMDWLTKNKLSWTNWNITDKHETTALLLPGASVNGNWMIEQLTPAGNYIRTQIRKLSK
ncbi:glycoside hydrolase family 5 protein [Mucilaginibacter sp.]